MSYELDYDRAIHLDAEDLAESGMGDAYNALLRELGKYVSEPARLEESIDNDRAWYSVQCGPREFVICNGSEIAAGDSWGLATFALFRIVNDQLEDSEVGFYAINGGNDLHGMFLTPAQAKAARAGLSRKQDWPYIPTDHPPWYGQPH